MCLLCAIRGPQSVICSAACVETEPKLWASWKAHCSVQWCRDRDLVAGTSAEDSKEFWIEMGSVQESH